MGYLKLGLKYGIKNQMFCSDRDLGLELLIAHSRSSSVLISRSNSTLAFIRSDTILIFTSQKRGR